MKKSNEKMAIKASIITIIGDILLTIFKMIVGIFGGFTAILADAVHSLTDMLTTVIVMIGVKLANREADKDHPYGHERFECVAAILLSIILFVTGAGIGWAGLREIMTTEYGEHSMTLGILALAAAVATIIVKETMYWYKRSVAKKIDSSALMADAWHHRIDALTSVGSFIGILGVLLGFDIFDPLAAIVICLFILKASIDIFRETVGKMTDKACDEKTENEMREIILAQDDVLGIDMLKTRLFGDKIYVEVEIAVDGSYVLHEAHSIAHRVHDAIESEFEKVKHCSVHVNPGK
ncbi:MAG: cation diffusion facilitator family transporter [Oscillospiraceae bacterium]|nr:cation diffusion facilitator family transporter [Oscillospiraceae bacterium]